MSDTITPPNIIFNSYSHLNYLVIPFRREFFDLKTYLRKEISDFHHRYHKRIFLCPYLQIFPASVHGQAS